MNDLLPKAFMRAAATPIPNTDTSDIDKTTLRVLSSVVKFIQSIFDNIEIRTLTSMPPGLIDWLLQIY